MERGNLAEGSTEEDHKDAIITWFFNSVNVYSDEKIYNLYYEDTDEYEVIASKLNVRVEPKETLDNNAYFIINREKSKITFKDSTLNSQAKNLNGSVGLVFSNLAAAREIEFFVSEKIIILNVPVYVSPGFEALAIIGQLGPCNFDKTCDTGEDWKNCRADCKPVGWTIFWILVLLLFALIIYIVLQEWYKKKYESYLFKDKNELFNLINFIDNAEKHGLKKDEIFKRLREKGWNNEQIAYAYNKLKGKRTGMWEIPIFKGLERKKMNKELEKRKKIGYKGVMKPAIGPKPIPKPLFQNQARDQYQESQECL